MSKINDYNMLLCPHCYYHIASMCINNYKYCIKKESNEIDFECPECKKSITLPLCPYLEDFYSCSHFLGCIIPHDIPQFCPATQYNTSDKEKSVTKEIRLKFRKQIFNILLHKKYIDYETARTVRIVKVNVNELFSKENIKRS